MLFSTQASDSKPDKARKTANGATCAKVELRNAELMRNDREASRCEADATTSLLRVFLHEGFHAVHGLDEEVRGGGVAAAHAGLAGGAERVAWDHGDTLLLKKFNSELLSIHAGATHVGKDVEGTSGIEAVQSHFIQPLHHEIAPLFVTFAHGFIRFGTEPKCFDGRHLAHDRCTKH